MTTSISSEAFKILRKNKQKVKKESAKKNKITKLKRIEQIYTSRGCVILSTIKLINYKRFCDFDNIVNK